MFFRRKKQPPDQRESYRRTPGEFDSIRVVLERSEQDVLDASLLDLTMRGAGLRVPARQAPGLQADEVLELTIESDIDGWKIRTPGVVRQIKPGQGGSIEYGIEFINVGQLYSQMDDMMARYFNRRSRVRVPVDSDRPVAASFYSTGHRLMAVVFDVTIHGVGLLVRHAEATALRVGAPANVSMKLPGSKKEIGGGTFIRQHRAIHDQDILGLEFDLKDLNGFVAHQDLIAAYCAKRLAERDTWEEPWCENTA